MEQPIRTLKEVLDEGLKITGEQELYDLDIGLAEQFGTLSIQGTTEQLMMVILAFRTAAMYAVNVSDLVDQVKDAAKSLEQPEEEKSYDA